MLPFLLSILLLVLLFNGIVFVRLYLRVPLYIRFRLHVGRDGDCLAREGGLVVVVWMATLGQGAVAELAAKDWDGIDGVVGTQIVLHFVVEVFRDRLNSFGLLAGVVISAAREVWKGFIVGILVIGLLQHCLLNLLRQQLLLLAV